LARPGYRLSDADYNALLHNNVPTSAGDAGKTRTSRRVDNGREALRNAWRAVDSR